MRQLHTPWHTPMVSFATPSSPMASRGRDVASSQELVGCRRAPGTQPLRAASLRHPQGNPARANTRAAWPLRSGAMAEPGDRRREEVR
eukprot:SAG25_NODE_3245_length_1160_cov_1.158341_3_plen_88_part_00